MKYFSMFSGIGGFEYGIGDLGECVGYSEVDKYADSIYKRHYPDHTNWGDAREIRTGELPDFDLLVGGFPCQSFSIAGKGRGFCDTRGTLFFEIKRVLQDKRPGYFLLENVKGLLSNKGGETFQAIIGILSSLGYFIEWQVLNSKDFGVPQNRERVFLIGHLGGGSGRKVFPIRRTDEATDVSIKIIPHRNGYRRNTQVFEPTGITEALDTGQGGGRGHYTVIDKTYNNPRAIDVANCITSREDRGISNHKAEGTAVICMGNVNPSGNGMSGNVFDSQGLSPTLTTGEGNKIAIPILTPDRVEKRQNGRRFKTDGEPSFTLTQQDKHGVYDGIRIRRLTPVECERLQGFPDNYTKFGGNGQEISNTQRYKVLGNAVTTNVVKAIMGKLNSI